LSVNDFSCRKSAGMILTYALRSDCKLHPISILCDTFFNFFQ